MSRLKIDEIFPLVIPLGRRRGINTQVLLAMCTALVRAGARIVYGGNLDPTGFTFKSFRHLAQAYSVRGPKAPFVHVVREPELRRADFDFDKLVGTLKEARGTVETMLPWQMGGSSA